MAKARLRHNKHQGMNIRRKSQKRPMSTERKLALKKLREASKAANEALRAKEAAKRE